VKCNPVQTELDDSEMNDDNYNNDRNRKYFDCQTHIYRQLTNQQYEAELMKMQLILTSKGGTRDSLTTVYSTLMNAKQFKHAEKIMTQLMAEIHAIRDIQNKVLAMQRSDWG
jgi:glutathione synthase/RimK-type ligase-like ATP-grasp enzyme